MLRPLLMSAVLIAATVAQPVRAATSGSDLRPEAGSGPTEVAAGGERIIETQAPLPGISQQTLALGREVYKDLMRVQRAAWRHDSIEARLALNDASRILDSFYEPAALRALRQQVDIIRLDLTKEGGRPEPGLWLPLKAELDQASIAVPTDHLNRAKQAVEEGQAAAATGDVKTAQQRLRVVEDVLDYRWSLLPLGKVRDDVNSAETALNVDPPYWKGAEQAMRSALAAVRWITTTDATGWLSAYEAAVDARFLLPKDPQGAQAALKRVASNLNELPDAAGLAKEARGLSAEQRPSVEAVEALISGLRTGLPHAGEGG
jgi:hypothetical protein